MTTAAPVEVPQQLLEELLAELERLPASRAAVLRVVQLVDDDGSSAAQVGQAAAADPALVARLLRLANSAYYGLSGRVTSATFAVRVVGFSTVRSLAAVAAAGLSGMDALPPGFWGRATAAASGAALVAPRTGATEAEAFSAGLLHDLGTALLHGRDRLGHARLVAQAAREGEPLARAEARAYGASAPQLCGAVLRAWQFPPALCEAVALARRTPHPVDPPLLRALQAGLALAEARAGAPTQEQRAALTVARVRRDEVPALQREVERARRELGAALAG